MALRRSAQLVDGQVAEVESDEDGHRGQGGSSQPFEDEACRCHSVSAYRKRGGEVNALCAWRRLFGIVRDRMMDAGVGRIRSLRSEERH